MTLDREWYIKNKDFEGALDRFHNTTARWKSHWWECLEIIYNKCKSLAQKYVLDSTRRLVLKLETLADMTIPLTHDCVGYKVYLFKFFKKDGSFHFTKIGTSKRDIMLRVKEEIRDYRKAGLDIGNVVIEAIIPCKNKAWAEGAESQLRANYIKANPDTYVANDRFFNVNLPISGFVKAVEEYFA